jgi:hypothetical protein
MHEEVSQLHAALHAERSDAVAGTWRSGDQAALQSQGVDGGLPPLVAAQESRQPFRRDIDCRSWGPISAN